MIKPTLYSSELQVEWNHFVQKSKNGTFLFNRNYMDYHADRFEDFSLILREDNEIVALLPANRRMETAGSHEGLSYGGFVSGFDMSQKKMLEIWDAAIQFLKQKNIKELIYKTIPSIYHTQPAEEDCYALFLAKASLYRRDVLTVLDYRKPVVLQKRRERGARKASQLGIEVQRSQEFAPFWKILEDNLALRHKIKPVHSVLEIQKLAKSFPDNIELYTAVKDNQVYAGAVLYLSSNVCHVQYNAASPEGREVGALDLLFKTLIEKFQQTKRFFDFGVSTEDEGTYLNEGLIEQKEGFGASTVVHDFYRLQIV